MANPLAAALATLPIGDRLTGEPILASGYGDLAAQLHRLYAINGAILPGPSWGNVPWKTTSSTYTQAPDLSASQLEGLGGCVVPHRLLRPYGTPLIYGVQVWAHAQDADLTVDLIAVDTDTSLADAKLLTVGATGEWVSATLTIPYAEAFEGDDPANPPRLLHLEWQGRRQTTEASVWTWFARELVIADGGDLPT